MIYQYKNINIWIIFLKTKSKKTLQCRCGCAEAEEGNTRTGRNPAQTPLKILAFLESVMLCLSFLICVFIRVCSVTAISGSQRFPCY